MIWYGIDPFIQSRIKFGDNVLFPLLADKSKQCLRLVDRILLVVIGQQMPAKHEAVLLTIVLSANARI